MGKVRVQHSDMCGCERCAKAWEHENPMPVYDLVDDPDVLDCGCSAWRGCDCWDDDGDYDDSEPFDDEDVESAPGLEALSEGKEAGTNG